MASWVPSDLGNSKRNSEPAGLSEKNTNKGGELTFILQTAKKVGYRNKLLNSATKNQIHCSCKALTSCRVAQVTQALDERSMPLKTKNTIILNPKTFYHEKSIYPHFSFDAHGSILFFPRAW